MSCMEVYSVKLRALLYRYTNVKFSNNFGRILRLPVRVPSTRTDLYVIVLNCEDNNYYVLITIVNRCSV